MTERKLYENITTGEERALYGLRHADVIACNFEGEEDGEGGFICARCKSILND